MFWQEVQMTSSPINTLLENENVTLTQLLGEDDILQECKTLNKQLVEFLVRPSTILELIQLIVEEPPNNVDLRQQYRNSAMACEIIASRVPTLSENIASDPKILGKLYSFLDSKPPLNPLLASFFAKTIEVLFTHSAAHQDWYTYQFMCLQVIEYFKTCPNFLPQILEHIGTSGIMNSLQYITQVPIDMMNNILTWLDSQNLIEKLIALICGTYTEIYAKKAVDDIISEERDSLDKGNSQPQTETSESKLDESECVAREEVSDGVVLNGPAGTKNNDDEALPSISSEKLDERLLMSRSANASQLICNFITKGREPNTDRSHRFNNPLLAKCLSAEIINQLLESMFTCPENNRKNAICNGIQVLLTLLNSNDETGQVQKPIVSQEEVHRIAEIITPWLPKFVDILTHPPIQSQGVTKDNAVGVARLTVAHLLVVMVNTDSSAVASAMLDHQVFTLLLDMFFQFQWNNFLHAHVEGIIEKALQAPSQKEIYKKHLFSNCNLIERIYTAWEENVTPDKARPGYMGHMIQIANHIERSLCPDLEGGNVSPVVDENEDVWNKLLVKLNEINTLYSTCLGGHHPADNSLQGSQPLPQECYTTEYLHHDINFNDGEDIITDTMNELPDNSEQMFSSMCENTSSSMGGNSAADHWTHANIKNITGENILEDNDNGSVDKTPGSLGDIEDSAYFELLINYTGHEAMNAFNKWLRNNDCPDWIDDNGRSPISPPVPSIGENNSSPWGDISNLTNEQSGWADFGNLQETAGISNVPNTFTCEAFAAFDQENVSSPKMKPDDKTTASQTEMPTVAQAEVMNEDSGINKTNEISIVNDLDTVKIEQIQSETLSDTVISVGGGTPTFADIVRQQPGAQKVVVNQLSDKPTESEEAKVPSGGSASDPTTVESVDTLSDTKTTSVDIDSLSQSLANINLAENTDDTLSNVNKICELSTDSMDKALSSAEEAVPTSQRDSDLDNIDPTVDNQR